MADITHTIGKYDDETKAVPVTFTDGDIVHSRTVNAVLKGNGAYDRIGTQKRVEEVARGVAVKFGLGVIKTPEPLPEVPMTDAPTE